MTSTPEKNNPANQVLVTPETFIPQIPNLTIMAILLLVFLFDYFIYQSWGRTDGLGLGTLILLSGVELSTKHKGQNQHLVGIGMKRIEEPSDIKYLDNLQQNRRTRIRRNRITR